MTAEPRTVWVHIGLHKTGSTYLQNVFRANRERVRAQGLEFTGAPGEPVQAFAVWDLQGRRPRGSGDARITGSWDALVKAVRSSGKAAALVSEERLSLSTLKQARRVVEAFPESDVRVLVTARDLGRVVVSAWQEEIKNDQTYPWTEFVQAVKDPAKEAVNPARTFWLRQDLAKICQTWEAWVPPDRIHVITVPQPPTPQSELLARFTEVVGLDPAVLIEQPVWSNEAVGVAGTEVIRRVNERLGGRLNQRQHDKVVKLAIVKDLAAHTEVRRSVLPTEEVAWVTQRAQHQIEAVRASGYHVVGDLDELLPRRAEGRRPDDATDVEMRDAAISALALLAERYATSWWARKRPDEELEGGDVDLSSWARGVVFRAQRSAAGLADRNPVAGRAMARVLKARDRARVRARDGSNA